MKSTGFGLSTKGVARDPNEDYLLVDDQLGIYVVSDGVGGHAGGEIASREAARELARFVAGHSEVLERILKMPDQTESLVEFGEDAFQAACERVNELGVDDPQLREMGTSLTAVLIMEGRALMVHVGDTRLYLYRDQYLHQLSLDHTMTAELVRRKVISEDDAVDHPYLHILTRSLGRSEHELADTLVFDLMPGDRLLLCSNGVSDFVGHSEAIADAMAGEDVGSVPEVLLDLAQSTGSTDDATALVIVVEADKETPVERPSGTLQIDELFTSLSNAAMFEGLNLRQLQRLRNISEEVVFRKGSTVIEEGKMVNGLHIVLKGGLSVTRGERALVELKPGDAFGVPSLLNPRPSRATIRPLRMTTILFVPQKRFQMLCERFPKLGTILLRRLGIEISKAVERAQLQLVRVAPDVLEEELPAGDLL